MTLVTGASGFLGGHLARLLSKRDEPLRLLLRPGGDPRRLAGISGERASGDLRDPASLRAAVRGCKRVYHVAADYRLWAADSRELYASNVEGTRNLLQAARDAQVEQVVYTSTVGTIGIRGDGTPGDEAAPVGVADMQGHYKRSKFLAERVALDFAAEGLPVVIVNPTAPVGESDWKPTPTGRIITDFLRGKMPAYLDTGLNLVDVHDVAAGHLLAAERGRCSERYILGGRNMSLREILDALARISGRPAPKVQIPYAAAWAWATLETGWARLSGRVPQASIEAVRAARKKMFVTGQKAREELGFEPSPVEPALQRAIEWSRLNRYC